MNKKLLILPVISALLLAGCTMGRTTKKKKKSSSVDVTSQSVAPTPTSGTPAPAPTSATPAPTPTSATPAPTPTSGTPAPTPTSGTPTPTPSGDWTEAQKTAMLENIGFVPEYMAGLDAAEYDSEYYEYWVVVENDIHASYEAILLAKGWTASEENPSSGTFEDGTAYTGYEYLKDSGTVDSESGKEVFFVSQMLVYDDEGTVTQFEWYAATDEEGGGEGGGGDEPAGTWSQVTTTPAAGTDYLIGLNNGTSDVFLDGSMQSTYYPGCQATTDTAIRFTVALSGEGFTIQATSGDVNGKYLGITVSGTHVNAVYGDTAYVWKWVDTDTYQGSTVEAHTFGAYEDGGYGSQWYILAQQSGKTTVSPTYNKWWSSNFIARLYQQAE